jgi:hypothetical protein
VNAEILATASTTVIALVTGWWTYRRFIESRQRETALTLDLKYTTTAYPGKDFLAVINVIVRNVGRVKVAVSDKRPAYHEPTSQPEYRFDYGFNLKIRKLPVDLEAGERIDWFKAPKKGWPSSAMEFDVATGYVKEVESNRGSTLTDFWMEPGEAYTLTVPVVLAHGSYLALVTLIGVKDGEYWQRLFVVNVPAP